jgi:reverse gyrase
MKPIYKFNNGNGATLCHKCRAIISTGKMTDDLYCEQCLNDPSLYGKIAVSKTNNSNYDGVMLNSNIIDEASQFVKPGSAIHSFWDQMDQEVHKGLNDLNI